MAIEVRLKKWGNSMAVIVPNRLIQEKKLKENDAMFVEMVKKADLSDIFGTLKLDRFISGQEFKDAARKGWIKNTMRHRTLKGAV